MSERIGIIDLGSNSARAVVFQVYRNRAYNLIHEQKVPVRLSEGAEKTHGLQLPAMARGLETLHFFKEICQHYQVDKVIAVATAAVRNASNGAEFLEEVREQTGFDFRILTGEEEAYYGFLGMINTLPEEDCLQFDLGGGSIELVWVQNRQIKESISLPLGAVTMTEKFQSQDKLSDKDQTEMLKWLQKQWKSLEWLKNAKDLPLVGTGGTVRNLAKMDQNHKKYPFSKLHNYRMGSISFRGLWKELSTSDLKDRKKWPGLSDGRADLILAGAGVIFSLLDYLKSPRIVVSGSGIREGLFFEHYCNIFDKTPIVSNILTHSTENMIRFYNLDEEHGRRVDQLSRSLFQILSEKLQLDERDGKLLQVSALLHDVGIVINYYQHARHSAYLIENGTLYGLSHREQIFCAVLAAWHGASGVKQIRRYYRQFLDDRDWIKARRMGLILGIAEILDEEKSGLVLKIDGTVHEDQVQLDLFCRENPNSEIKLLEPLLQSFQKETGLKVILNVRIFEKTVDREKDIEVS